MKILKVHTPERQLGDLGEKLAASYLKDKGYKILERNYVAFENEIDIIAENKDTLAFVEVKTRNITALSPIEPRPASAVTPDKQRKIIAAAKYYLAVRDINKHVSLDVIEVYVNGEKNKIIHMENAFNINTAYSRKAYR